MCSTVEYPAATASAESPTSFTPLSPSWADITGPVIATIHDLLRLNHPQHCYTDDQFSARFGANGLSLLQDATRRLRDLTESPPGATRTPRSWHEEFYALPTPPLR